MKTIFSSCPHDVVNDPEKWSQFVQFINQELQADLDFKRYLSFDDFATHFDTYDLVYAHPLHAVQLQFNKNFIPLARYQDVYDEAVLITSAKNISPSFEKMKDAKVACILGSPSHAAFLIEKHARFQAQFNFEPVPQDSYPNVLMSVAINEADYGVILNSVWKDMVSMKERVQSFHVTQTKALSHVFMLSPRQKAWQEKITKILTQMHNTPRGKEILKRLKCPALVPVQGSEMQALQAVLSKVNL